MQPTSLRSAEQPDGESDRGADDPALGERGVDDAMVPESLLQPFGDAEDAAVEAFSKSALADKRARAADALHTCQPIVHDIVLREFGTTMPALAIGLITRQSSAVQREHLPRMTGMCPPALTGEAVTRYVALLQLSRGVLVHEEASFATPRHEAPSDNCATTPSHLDPGTRSAAHL